MEKFVKGQILKASELNEMVDSINSVDGQISELSEKVGDIDQALAAILGINETEE